MPARLSPESLDHGAEAVDGDERLLKTECAVDIADGSHPASDAIEVAEVLLERCEHRKRGEAGGLDAFLDAEGFGRSCSGSPEVGPSRRRLGGFVPPRVLVILSLVLALVACGGGQEEASVASPQTLPRALVPGLAARDRTLDMAALAEATPLDGLEESLRDWGVRSAAEREFVGRSDRFHHVVSRTIEFATSAGAHSYVDLLARKADVFLGSSPTVKPFSVGGWWGYRITPRLCGCHGEPPEAIALLVDRSRVAWLDLSGPGVNRRVLRRLSARAVAAAQASDRLAAG
jgi:hypothetical protein